MFFSKISQNVDKIKKAILKGVKPTITDYIKGKIKNIIMKNTYLMIQNNAQVCLIYEIKQYCLFVKEDHQDEKKKKIKKINKNGEKEVENHQEKKIKIKIKSDYLPIMLKNINHQNYFLIN